MYKSKFIIVALIVFSFILGGCGGNDSTSKSNSDTNNTTEIPDEIETLDPTDKTAPVFTTKSTTTINENQILAIRLAATDISTVSYSLVDGGDADSFDINATTGMVSFRVPPNYGEQPSYSFSAMAIDALGNETIQEVVITIIEDTTAPVFTSFIGSIIDSISVFENRNFTHQVVATDTSKVSYSIQNTDTWGQYFNIDSQTGIIKFKDEHLANYEISTQYFLIIKATDVSGNEATQDITVNVKNEILLDWNSIDYESVLSPITGRIWLDRNLGARNKCEGSADSEDCFGDYYQWGREADGHEKSNSTSIGILTTSATYLGRFITNQNTPWDWTESDIDGALRTAFLANADGEYSEDSVCLYGYRVPTIEEIQAELGSIENNAGAFNSFLKLPRAGIRTHLGAMYSQGLFTLIRSNSVNGSFTDGLGFSATEAISLDNLKHASGIPVRCIKDSEVDITPPIITSPSSVSVLENTRFVMSITATDDSAENISGLNISIINLDTWGQYFDLNYNGSLSFKEGYEANYEIAREYYLRIKVTDSSGNGTIQDIIISIEDEQITHNSFSYESVISPLTNRTWLDRNLGAERKCERSLDDEECFGDYYQWGRATDGHEKATSLTSLNLADDINDAGDRFIVETINPDWASIGVDRDRALRAQNWSSTDGSSICPSGYRVPTSNELMDEIIRPFNSIDTTNNVQEAFDHFLKIPSAGWRMIAGRIIENGSSARLYTGDVDLNNAVSVLFNSTLAEESYTPFTTGVNVRCIKH